MQTKKLAAIVAEAQAGSDAAFARLFELGKNRVYYLGLQMLKNPADAEDMVQEVFLTIYQKLPSLQQPQAYPGWLRQITVNRCKNKLSQKGYVLFTTSDEGDTAPPDTAETEPDFLPQAALEKGWLRTRVLSLVQALPPDQRFVILLHYYEQMKTAEIAAALTISENTVKSRLSYARKKLRASIEAENKRGARLYSVLPAPLLLLLFKKDSILAASTAGIPAIAAEAAAMGTASAAAGGASAASAATTGLLAKLAAAPFAAKGVAAAAAALAVGTGVFAASGALDADAGTFTGQPPSSVASIVEQAAQGSQPQASQGPAAASNPSSKPPAPSSTSSASQSPSSRPAAASAAPSAPDAQNTPEPENDAGGEIDIHSIAPPGYIWTGEYDEKGHPLYTMPRDPNNPDVEPGIWVYIDPAPYWETEPNPEIFENDPGYREYWQSIKDDREYWVNMERELEEQRAALEGRDPIEPQNGIHVDDIGGL